MKTKMIVSEICGFFPPVCGTEVYGWRDALQCGATDGFTRFLASTLA